MNSLNPVIEITKSTFWNQTPFRSPKLLFCSNIYLQCIKNLSWVGDWGSKTYCERRLKQNAKTTQRRSNTAEQGKGSGNVGIKWGGYFSNMLKMLRTEWEKYHNLLAYFLNACIDNFFLGAYKLAYF